MDESQRPLRLFPALATKAADRWCEADGSVHIAPQRTCLHLDRPDAAADRATDPCAPGAASGGRGGGSISSRKQRLAAAAAARAPRAGDVIAPSVELQARALARFPMPRAHGLDFGVVVVKKRPRVRGRRPAPGAASQPSLFQSTLTKSSASGIDSLFQFRRTMARSRLARDAQLAAEAGGRSPPPRSRSPSPTDALRSRSSSPSPSPHPPPGINRFGSTASLASCTSASARLPRLHRSGSTSPSLLDVAGRARRLPALHSGTSLQDGGGLSSIEGSVSPSRSEPKFSVVGSSSAKQLISREHPYALTLEPYLDPRHFRPLERKPTPSQWVAGRFDHSVANAGDAIKTTASLPGHAELAVLAQTDVRSVSREVLSAVRSFRQRRRSSHSLLGEGQAQLRSALARLQSEREMSHADGERRRDAARRRALQSVGSVSTLHTVGDEGEGLEWQGEAAPPAPAVGMVVNLSAVGPRPKLP